MFSVTGVGSIASLELGLFSVAGTVLGSIVSLELGLFFFFFFFGVAGIGMGRIVSLDLESSLGLEWLDECH